MMDTHDLEFNTPSLKSHGFSNTSAKFDSLSLSTNSILVHHSFSVLQIFSLPGAASEATDEISYYLLYDPQHIACNHDAYCIKLYQIYSLRFLRTVPSAQQL